MSRKKIKKKQNRKEKRTLPYFFEGSFIVKFLGGVITYAVIVIILLFGSYPRAQKFVVGQLSPSNIVAKLDFKYSDPTRNKHVLEEHLETLPVPFKINQTVQKKSRDAIAALFTALETLDREDKMVLHQKISQIEPLSKACGLTEKQMKELLSLKDLAVIQRTTNIILDKLFRRGILPSTSKKTFYLHSIQVFDPQTKTWRKRSPDSFFMQNNLSKIIPELVDEFAPKTLKEPSRSLAIYLIGHQAEPNLEMDTLYYQTRRDEVINSIPIIYTFMQKGENLVTRGEIIQEKHLAMLDAQYQESLRLKGWSYRSGICFLLFIFFLITIFYLKIFQTDVFSSNSKLLLLEIITVGTILLGYFFRKTLLFFPSSEFFTPVAVCAMLIALLIDSRLSVFYTLIICLVLSLMTEEKLFYGIVTIGAGITAIYSLFEARKRSSLIKAGFFSSIATVLCLLAIGTINQTEPALLFEQSLWGFASGLLSAFLVMGILPYIEYLFKITTDIGLLELSDFNHPLLKELVVKAPGTYHHSLIVGNLAEAAAEKVQANPLLARVQGYFHDIGKLNKPEYFSENEWRDSLHDELNPSMSSLIIVSHVKDGIDLALKHKIQKKIIDAIREHHGTSLVYYFFKKALDDSTEESKVSKEHFRYPGPNPQSKETAIIMLADSVEAASRSISNPTPSKIKKIVEDIINTRIIDGQLNESPLTIKDLNIIKETFIYILTSIFHTRKQYPTEETVPENGKKREKQIKKET